MSKTRGFPRFLGALKRVLLGEGRGESGASFENAVPEGICGDILAESALSDRMRADALAAQLLYEVDAPQRGGLYWETQIAFAYDSCRIEGIELTHDQTRQLYETRTVDGPADLDDLVAVNNHFCLFEHMVRTLDEPLSKELILRFNGILSSKSAGGLEEHFEKGSFKELPNGVANVRTSPPHLAEAHVDHLLGQYLSSPRFGYEQMAAFHIRFETIHPFKDGNGRVGRMILFRECLRNGLVPPVVPDALKSRYYAALATAPEDIGILVNFFKECASLYLISAEPLISVDLLPESERVVGFRDPSLDLREASELLGASRYAGEDIDLDAELSNARAVVEHEQRYGVREFGSMAQEAIDEMDPKPRSHDDGPVR